MRLIGPDEGSRLVYAIRGDNTLSTGGGMTATVYADAGATTLADILTYPGGVPVAGSELQVAASSLLPLFQFPDGADVVYVRVGVGGGVFPVYARTGNAATRDVGTTAGTVAAGDDSRIVGAVQSSQVGITVARQGAAIMGPRVGEIGDSIPGFVQPHLVYGAIASNGAWEATQIAYYNGFTSTQVLGQVTAITGAADPVQVCVVHVGSNDAAQLVSLATFSTAIQGIVAALRAAGIAPVLCTVPPRSTTTATITLIATYNLWLGRYCAAQRIPLVDTFSLLANPASGRWLAAYDSGDQTHPNGAGQKVIGGAIATALAPAFVGTPMIVLPYSGAPNLLTNSQFLSGTTSPTGYDTAFISAGYTSSLVADPRGFKWWRLTAAGATALTSTEYMSLVDVGPGTYAPGDTLKFSLRLRQAQNVTSETVGGYGSGNQILVDFYNAAWGSVGGVTLTSYPGGAYGLTETHDGLLSKVFAVPALTEHILIRWSTGRSNGTYDIAQPTLLNLTALGLA